MAEESQYLSFNGIHVHLRVAVPEERVTSRMMIVSSPLIHSFHWRKVVPELMSSNCLTVMVDLPGFGRSDCDRPTPQDAETRAAILWGVLDAMDDALGTQGETWHLCAHGTACPTILKMAEMYPDSVRSQIHLSPVLTLPKGTGREADKAGIEESLKDREGFRRFVEALSGYPMDDYILDRMRAPFARPGAKRTLLHMLHDARLTTQTALGFCPAMVLSGGRDPMMDDAARAEIETRLAGAETHLLRTAGHLPMETHSKALRDYFRGWLRYNA